MGSQKSLMPAKAGVSSVTTEGTKGAQRGALSPGLAYPGRVTAVGDNLYTVQVDDSSQPIANCRCMLGLFAGLLGYRTTLKLGLGDRVMVVVGSPSYIIATGGRDVADRQNPDSRTHTGYGLAAGATPIGPDRTHTPPNDMVSGEFEIANLMGMAFVAAQGMMALKAGDRAKLEVFLTDGLVRLVSENYRHHSALGDLEIYNDGRLNCVFNGTSYAHEAMGAKKASDEPSVKLKGNQVDMSSEKAAIETGRWRFSSYVGWLGDFIHAFVTDPHEAAAEIGAEGWRSGRSSLWQGNDGSLLVQTCGGEIAFEKVIRILVPRQKVRPNDSTGDAEFDALEERWNAMWKTRPEKTCDAAFQLREYARWFSQTHALARFRQASKDWEVPKESDVPAPSPFNMEGDREAVQADTVMVESYATIRIMRDGSIVVRSASGNAIAMAGLDMWVSATRNLHLEAGGDIRVVAGRNFLVKARRSVELIAVKGGITFFAKTWWKALCTQGSVWLRSDADTEASEPPTPDAPEDPVAEVLPHGVYLHASRGRTLLRSNKEVRVKIDSAPVDDADDSCSFTVDTAGDFRARAARNIEIVTRSGYIAIAAAKAMTIRCRSFLLRASFVDFCRSLTLVKGEWSTARMSFDLLKAQTIQGGPAGMIVPEGSRVGRHENHVQLLQKNPDGSPWRRPQPDVEDLEPWKVAEAAVNKQLPPVFHTGVKPQWGFETQDTYTFTEEDHYETLTQQELNTTTLEGVGSWSFSNDSATGAEVDVARAKMWGSTYSFWQHRGGSALNLPSSTDPVSAPTQWSKNSGTFKYFTNQS